MTSSSLTVSSQKSRRYARLRDAAIRPASGVDDRSGSRGKAATECLADTESRMEHRRAKPGLIPPRKPMRAASRRSNKYAQARAVTMPAMKQDRDDYPKVDRDRLKLILIIFVLAKFGRLARNLIGRTYLAHRTGRLPLTSIWSRAASLSQHDWKLVDSDAGELLAGEGTPGLTLAGGGGHA
jgi:hypothetical protein